MMNFEKPSFSFTIMRNNDIKLRNYSKRDGKLFWYGKHRPDNNVSVIDSVEICKLDALIIG